MHDGVPDVLYRPLTIWSYLANEALTPGSAWAYHLVNILLHAMVSVLVSVLACRISARNAVVGAFAEKGNPIAGLTAGQGVVRVFGPPPGGPLSAFDIYGGHLAVRRDVFEVLGGFDATFTRDGNYGCEDREFGRRLLERYVVVGDPGAVCQHRKLIDPMAYVRRARQSARSEARLLRKHPGLREDLIRWSGAASRSKRLRLALDQLFKKVVRERAGRRRCCRRRCH